jgi:hypothetical protein
MSVAVVANLAVGFVDWGIDMLRKAVGLDPRPPALSLKFETQPMVRVQTALQAEMRRTFYAHALIEQDEAVLYDAPMPLDGRIGVMPMTPEPIRVRVTQEGRDRTARHGTAVTETVIEPLPNGPAVERFYVPANATLGGSFAASWDAPRADRVRLAVIEDNEVSDHIGPPTGQLVVPALRPGRVLIRLTAETGWGQTTVTKPVIVAPPALKLIALRPSTQAGYPGSTLTFEFKASGAENLWLIAPDADAPQRLGNTGGLIEVSLGLRPVEFEVIARGRGGTERSLILRAIPDPFAGLETDHH